MPVSTRSKGSSTSDKNKKNKVKKKPTARERAASVKTELKVSLEEKVEARPLESIIPEVDSTQNTDFTARDFDDLSANEHYRYLGRQKYKTIKQADGSEKDVFLNKVGHAVLAGPDGDKTAYQYAIPFVKNADEAPDVRPLINIQEITRFTMKRYRAETPDTGTKMYATRFVDLEFNNNGVSTPMKIACFSPNTSNKSEPFWGGTNFKTKIFRKNLSKEVRDEFAEIEPYIKDSPTLLVDPESVRERDAIKTRKPSQNEVMGESAKIAYENFLSAMTDELTADMRGRLQRSIDAPLRQLFYSNYRPEWLHREGFGLTPMHKDPQVEDNLGAAPKWTNTEMMILERIVKWFALNAPETYSEIKCKFEMLLDSELIEKINFQVTVHERDKFVKLMQEIDPFKKHHIFRKASDLAQATAITHSLLKENKPAMSQKVRSATARPVGETPYTTSSFDSFSGLTSSSSASSSSSSSSFLMAKALEEKELKTHKQAKAKKIPTHLKHENSIVQVMTTHQTPDFDEPWKGTQIWRSSGTGVVINHEGKNYILTNAHCVVDSEIVRLRIANHTKKFKATVKQVSYQCDLALLECDSPEFLSKVKPAEIGKMVSLQDKVKTIGFPMGGDEISVTKGITSRIEVQEYSMSGLDMLQVQVDSAINSGNSGGPVFSDGKVVGIAFQGIDRAQLLGYMIPIPIVDHFLKEVFSGKAYRGFPVLPVEFHSLESPTLRKYYGLNENETGLVVGKIDYLSDAFKKLQQRDVVLEIDGYKVSNDGTVEIPNVGNRIDMVHLTHSKFVDDEVKLKIIRKDKDTGELMRMQLSITLDSVPHQNDKVPAHVYDKMPTFYIASGLAFQPVTRNYLAGSGGDLDEIITLEGGYYLADIPKHAKNEEFIVISEVFDCEETEGYGGHTNNLVKEINGHKISNMRDLVLALESNKSDTHEIYTRSKLPIVIKNMSKAENDALLRRYKVSTDRSDDLMNLSKPYKAVRFEDVEEKHVERKSILKKPARQSSSEVTDAEPKEAEAKLFSGRATPGLTKFYGEFLSSLESRVPKFGEDKELDLGMRQLEKKGYRGTVNFDTDSEDDSDYKPNEDEMCASEDSESEVSQSQSQSRMFKSAKPRGRLRRIAPSSEEESSDDEIMTRKRFA